MLIRREKCPFRGVIARDEEALSASTVDPIEMKFIIEELLMACFSKVVYQGLPLFSRDNRASLHRDSEAMLCSSGDVSDEWSAIARQNKLSEKR